MRLARQARAGRPSRSRTIAAAGGGGGGGGLAARTTEPTFISARFDPFTGNFEQRQIFSTVGTVLTGDICVVSFMTSSLDGEFASQAITDFGYRNSVNSIREAWPAELANVPQITTDSFDIAYAIGAGSISFDNPYTTGAQSNTGNGSAGLYACWGDTDGTPSLVASGLFGTDAGWTWNDGTDTLTFPEQTIPTGYHFMYLILCHGDPNSGGLGGWTNATAAVNGSTTIGYDFEHYAAYATPGTKTVSVVTGVGFNNHFTTNNFPAYGFIIAVPGTP